MRTTLAHRSRLLTVIGMIAMTGCRVGPDYRPPPLPAGADAPLVSLAAAAVAVAPLPDPWWKLYNDPRLDELVDEALHANADLAAAEANCGGGASTGRRARFVLSEY